MLTRNDTDTADPGAVPSLAKRWSHHWREGGPITGEKVVPSHWRNSHPNGPMPMAGDIRPRHWHLRSGGIPHRCPRPRPLCRRGLSQLHELLQRRHVPCLAFELLGIWIPARAPSPEL